MNAETKLTSQPDPYLGRTFDGYRIESRIGHGGMGVVYKATQLSLDRPVAIKLMHESALDQPQFRARFEREVDVLSKLSHPNIVTVLERGEIDDRPYLVMEYVAGASLRDVLKKGPLPSTEALLVVRGVLAALEHAHDKSIIHRDIKPENILVAPGGIVKVADFGLGRLLGPVDTTRLTHTHLLLGTFEYMSPEQREKSKEADQRADLYATGIILYESIAGELPIGHFAPLSLKRPAECDKRIDGVVRRSLEKNPEERYQRASEMGFDVSRILSAPLSPELGARLVPDAPQPEAGTVVEEGAFTPTDATRVREGAHEPESEECGPPSFGVKLFVVALLAGAFAVAASGGVAIRWLVLLAGGIAIFGVLRALQSRPADRVPVAAQESKTRTPSEQRQDWHLGLGVTALWVAIVLMTSSGKWRDEEIMWLCIGAVASVFLIPKLRDFGKVVLWFGVTFGVVMIPVLLFYGSMEVEPGDAPHMSYSGTCSVAAVTKTLTDNERRAVIRLWGDPSIRSWIVAVAPSVRQEDLELMRVSYAGSHITLLTGVEISERAKEAIGFLYSRAIPGKVEPHRTEWLTQLEDTPFPSEQVKRIVAGQRK